MPRGDKGNWGGRRITTRPDAKKPGRPRTSVQVVVDLDTAALAQRLMLHFPEIPTVEALFAHALRELAARTDD
jgi:hypothetical protein